MKTWIIVSLLCVTNFTYCEVNDVDIFAAQYDTAWFGEFVEEVASTENVPLEIITRLIFLESTFGKDKIRAEANGSYSVGMMQLNSACTTYFDEKFYREKEIYGAFSPMDDYHNVIVGIRYFKYLFNRYGDYYYAAVAYNCGPGNVDRGTIPESSKAYGLFVSTGEYGQSHYMKKRATEFNNRILTTRLKLSADNYTQLLWGN